MRRSNGSDIRIGRGTAWGGHRCRCVCECVRVDENGTLKKWPYEQSSSQWQPVYLWCFYVFFFLFLLSSIAVLLCQGVACLTLYCVIFSFSSKP